MSSADLVPFVDFIVDVADAAGDLFSGLSFFLGSLETASGLFG